ncbi:hypothetical protein VN1330_07480 [Helicobacter pylori]|nr:hypothetical protein VN1241_12980 [Helicobacter pylori]GHR61512.1 hypothetical protein VN0559_06620 [Helicobacter pylori]GHS24328.1 hypothetical protein VN1154_05820 [Helicobacter pylori]
MLDQDVLQNSHEAGVGGLESEILNGFVSFIKSIYECQKKRKRPQRSAQAHRHCDSKGWGA